MGGYALVHLCETKAANSSSHTGCHSFLGFSFFFSTTSISGTVSTTTILFFGEVEGFYPVQKKDLLQENLKEDV